MSSESESPPVVVIDRTRYDVAPAVAFSPRRGGEPDPVYFVARDAEGRVRCTCPDFVYRRAAAGEACKHGQAAVAAGLV